MSAVSVAMADGVATVTIDNPPVNALTGDMMRELASVFGSIAGNWDVRVMVLTAAGERAFCGGVDLNDSARRHGASAADADPRDVVDSGRAVRDCFWAVLDCPVPVISAINGAAVGAGLALVACTDLLYASTTARFALPEINAGVLGGARHLQRLVGTFKARSMFFSGDFVPAAEFYRLGALEAVVEPGELQGVVAARAAQLAAKSPIGIRLAKESINRVEHQSLQDGYRTEQDYTNRMTRYEDSAEARRAFLEKRAPNWQRR